MTIMDRVRGGPLPACPTPRYMLRVLCIYAGAGLAGGLLFLIGAALYVALTGGA